MQGSRVRQLLMCEALFADLSARSNYICGAGPCVHASELSVILKQATTDASKCLERH